MTTYRCIKRGKELIVFDRAGNPVFKREGQARQVWNYETGAIEDLPDDSRLTCVDVNAKPSICARFAAPECNAFSDICQGYTYKGARRCRRRNMSFKSLNALERCYYEKEQLLSELADLKGRTGSDMDQPVSETAWDKMAAERYVADIEARLAEVNQEKLEILQALAAEREKVTHQAAAMSSPHVQALIGSMTAEIQQLKQGNEVTVQAARREIDLLSANVRALENEKKQVTAEKKQIVSEIERERFQYAQQMETQQQALQSQITELKIQAAVGVQNIQQQSALTAQFQDLTAQLQESKQQVAAMESAFQRESAERIAAHEQKIVQLESKIGDLKEQSVACQADLKINQEARSQELDEYDQSSRQLKFDSEQQIEQLRQTIAAGTARADELQRILSAKEAAAIIINQDYEAAKDKLGALQALEIELRTDVNGLLAQNQQQTEQYSIEKQGIESRLAVLQDQNERLLQFETLTKPQLLELEGLRSAYATLVAAHQEISALQQREHASFSNVMEQSNEELLRIRQLQATQLDVTKQLQLNLDAANSTISQLEDALTRIVTYLTENNSLTSDQKTKFAQAFGITVPPASASRSSGKSRKIYAKQQYVLDLLQEVIDIIKSAHSDTSTTRRRRYSARR